MTEAREPSCKEEVRQRVVRAHPELPEDMVAEITEMTWADLRIWKVLTEMAVPDRLRAYRQVLAALLSDVDAALEEEGGADTEN